MKLLIVDDSAIIRKAIQKYVDDFKATIEIVGTASDGKEAVQKFKELKPDLVTLDITMPEMDGLAVLNEIMKMNPNAKVLVITALTDEATALQALKKGAKGFLGKPFNADKFKEAFQQFLGV